MVIIRCVAAAAAAVAVSASVAVSLFFFAVLLFPFQPVTNLSSE